MCQLELSDRSSYLYRPRNRSRDLSKSSAHINRPPLPELKPAKAATQMQIHALASENPLSYVSLTLAHVRRHSTLPSVTLRSDVSVLLRDIFLTQSFYLLTQPR